MRDACVIAGLDGTVRAGTRRTKGFLAEDVFPSGREEFHLFLWHVIARGQNIGIDFGARQDVCEVRNGPSGQVIKDDAGSHKT